MRVSRDGLAYGFTKLGIVELSVGPRQSVLVRAVSLHGVWGFEMKCLYDIFGRDGDLFDDFLVLLAV